MQLQSVFERSKVFEPSKFEPAKFDCIYKSYIIGTRCSKILQTQIPSLSTDNTPLYAARVVFHLMVHTSP
jgi:hypothetical protein